MKEEEQKKIEEKIKKELEIQMPIWIQKGYDKKKIIQNRKELIKMVTTAYFNQKHNEEINKEKAYTESALTTNDLVLNLNDRGSSNERRRNSVMFDKFAKISDKNEKPIENTEKVAKNEKNQITEKKKKTEANLNTEKFEINPEKNRKVKKVEKAEFDLSKNKFYTNKVPEKEKVPNPFVENLENQVRQNQFKNISNNPNLKFFTEETTASNNQNDKIIYTNKGWGIFDYKKFGIKLAQNVEKAKNDRRNMGRNNRYEKESDKSSDNNFSNNQKKKQFEKRNLEMGNQRIIYRENNKMNPKNENKKHNRLKSRDFWIGNKFDDSDDNAEWG